MANHGKLFESGCAGSEMEIELKLLVARGDLDRVLTAGAVERRSRGPARTSELTSVYFDTPDGHLLSRGLALRLRRSGGRWLQTLKSDAAQGARGAAGLHAREEYEWAVAGRRIDFALLAKTPYGSVFASRRTREDLRPAFSTRFRRTALRLDLEGGAQAELCTDLGWIRAGNARAPICEVEIELDPGAGGPAALFAFARALLEEVPFRLGAMSKAERGYAIARGDRPRPRKAEDVALHADMNRAGALFAIARACLAQVHANEDGFLSDRDPEFLHQLRVGYRMLRVALAMPEDPDWRAAREPLREELRWLFSAIGPARNWDVFLTEVLPPLLQRERGDAGLAAFRARCLRRRRRHLAAAREAVRGARYTALLLAIGELLAGPLPAEAPGQAASARSFASAVIERRDRALRRRGGTLAEASPEDRHRARIAAKKLRYCAEFFAALYPHKRAGRYVEALSELQDALGAVNDAAICARLIGEAGASGRVDGRTIGLVQGWVAAAEARAVDGLARAWDGFARRTPFWT